MENKRHYSYFMIKPDGIKYLSEIEEELKNKFTHFMYFAVDDWETTQKDIYEEHYKKSGKKFADSYQAFINSEKTLYGNNAIAVLVSSRENYDDLMEKVLQTKLEIRERLGYKVGLVTTQNADNENAPNQVVIMENDGTIKRAKRFDENKRYRLSHLDVIHCPDANKKTTLSELEKLKNQDIINDKNLLSEKLIDNIKKYKSGEFIHDRNLKENQLVTADYSGYINKITEEDERE